jgi:signal transduction histidine kinase
MKPKLPPLPQSYLSALRKYIQYESASAFTAARRLGVRALSLGWETLDLAKIHEEALTTLIPSGSVKNTDTLIRRAGAFFAESITPIEETHRGAPEANVQLKDIVATLTRRTSELAASNEELRQEIARRKAVEDSLRTSEATSSGLLQKSRLMQEELHHLSRRLLSAQEEERKRISRELHDVIGQTLTGITVRLATLQSRATTNGKDLHRKIGATQRLVEKSVDLVHRFARRGFVVDTAAAEHSKRLGLLGMRERVEMAGGRFAVESIPGSGTTTRVEIPFTKVSAKKLRPKSRATHP